MRTNLGIPHLRSTVKAMGATLPPSWPMAYTQKAMAKVTTPSLLLLHGPDTFRSRSRLRAIRDEFSRETDPSGCNLAVLEGKGLSLEVFERDLTAAPFLASARLVVVEGWLASKPKAEVQERVMALLQRARDAHVVFWEGELTPAQLKGRLAIAVAATGAVEVFAPLAGRELTQWYTTRVRELGGQLTPAAADLLAAAVGDDLWRAEGELRKLTAYARGRNIEPADVRALTPARWQEETFALADAIGSRAAAAALRHSRQLLAHGVSAPELLGMVAWQFRNLLGVKRLATDEPGLTAGQIAVRLQLHPYVARKTLEQATRFGLEELVATYRQLLAVDLKLKTGLADHGVLFDLLLLRLASGRPRPGG